MEMTDYEYSVEQKCEGKWRLFKWLMLTLYAAFVTGYFVAIYLSRIFVLGALIPVFLWILVFFTWKYIKPEYKYKISEAHISFFRVIGKKEKEVIKIKISTAAFILPLENALEKIRDFAPQKTYSALPSQSSTDCYIILYTADNGTRSAFMFKATAQALKCLYFYNSKTVLSDTDV